MTTRFIKTEDQRSMAIKLIESRKIPMTVTVLAGVKRSDEQNHLQAAIIKDIAEQRGDVTTEEVRAECKLRYGVPIRRRDDPAYRAQYDEIIMPLSYEEKLKCMMPPFDLPVTRDMKVKQMTEYIDTLFREYGAQGIVFMPPGMAVR